MAWKEISPYNLTENPFVLMDKEWALILAGTAENNNAMTASWGQLGIMWGKPVANIYIRPQRYTREFVEENERFSLNFFEGEAYRPALELLGTKSGRDTSKMADCGLHVSLPDGTPLFEEAKLVLVCRKLYCQRMDAPFFLDAREDARWYPEKDYHYMYVAEIEKALQA